MEFPLFDYKGAGEYWIADDWYGWVLFGLFQRTIMTEKNIQVAIYRVVRAIASPVSAPPISPGELIGCHNRSEDSMDSAIDFSFRGAYVGLRIIKEAALTSDVLLESEFERLDRGALDYGWRHTREDGLGQV